MCSYFVTEILNKEKLKLHPLNKSKVKSNLIFMS